MDPTVLQGSAMFTGDLYRILSRKSGNVLFSPFSIHAILSMTSQGAGGDSAEAFTKTLHVPDIPSAATGYKTVIEYLNSLECVTLLIANKIYAQKKAIQFIKKFENTVKENFRSEIEFVDFVDQETPNIINQWVAQKTNNKIKKLVEDSLKGQTGLVLINTILFKGKWSSEFDEENTVTDKFYLESGDTVDVQMMSKTETFMDYVKNEEIGIEAAAIDFAEFGAQMIFILPFENISIKDVETKLTNYNVDDLIKSFKNTRLNFELPKFRIEETIGLKEVLKEMGLDVIFDPEKADFGGIIQDEKLHVGDIIQKAYIDVNEYGCEASAATAVEMLTTCCLQRQQPILFKVNRPCIFMLVVGDEDNRTNILFYGRLSHPIY